MYDKNCTCAFVPTNCMMEVLFEFQGSRRLLKPQSSEAVVELVLAEVKKFDQYAFILCGSISDNDPEQSNAEPRVGYLLQKWSQKWDAYMDVITVDEVDDGDKLTVTLKPAKSKSISVSRFLSELLDNHEK